MSTVRKIEGAIEKRIATAFAQQATPMRVTVHIHDTDQLLDDVPVVLIVSSDGQPPRYFTQEEVKAMLEQAEMVARTMGSMFLDEAEARELAAADFNTLKAKHGIDL